MKINSNSNVKAVLFDLDGTLVDTAKDFVRILHELAQENNFTAPSNQQIIETVSAGSKAMVSLFTHSEANGIQAQANIQNVLDDAKIEHLRQQFLDRYEANICEDSCLFEGLDLLLTKLEDLEIPWGVVTNKPRYLSEKLLEKLQLTDRCAVLVCPDDVTNSKPHPESMYLAMDALGIATNMADKVIYIGDHIRDIQAGKNAGNITITAGYGYVTAEEDLPAWNADYIVMTSTALTVLIDEIKL